MSSDLRGCESCGCHIRISEPSCPFCGAIPSEAFRTPRARSAALGKVGRAAFVAAGTAVVAGVVVGVAGCSTSVSDAYGMPPVEADAGNDAQPTPSPAYGIPVQLDAGDAGDGHVSMADAYGIPVGDAGSD